MISLYRRSDGGFLTTIKVMGSLSWVLNERGKAEFNMSLADAKSTRRHLATRNLIYFDGKDGMPPWGGVLETDETWRSDNTIDYTGWSAEHLLKWRRPTTGLIRAASPGGLFEALINIANKEEDLLIRSGDIYRGGNEAETTLDGTDLLEVIQDLAKRWNMDFSIDPVLDSAGKLSFSANWYAKQGVRRSLALKEGFNFERTGTTLKVQRMVVNRLTGMGDASTDARPTWKETNQASRDTYGLTEGTENFDGVVNLDTVKGHTVERSKVMGNPQRVPIINALNKDDNFANCRKGDYRPFQAFTFGWLGDDEVGMDTFVRILGMKYAMSTDICELTNEEEIL